MMDDERKLLLLLAKTVTNTPFGPDPDPIMEIAKRIWPDEVAQRARPRAVFALA